MRLIVATTVGNEVVNCTLTQTGATCQGNLVGTPIAGAPVLLSSNGAVIAQGTVVSGVLPPPAPGTLTTQQAITQAQGLTGLRRRHARAERAPRRSVRCARVTGTAWS